MFDQVMDFAESEISHWELIHGSPFCRETFMNRVVCYARITTPYSFDHDEVFKKVIDPILSRAK